LTREWPPTSGAASPRPISFEKSLAQASLFVFVDDTGIQDLRYELAAGRQGAEQHHQSDLRILAAIDRLDESLIVGTFSIRPSGIRSRKSICRRSCALS
jgi:hypothetical protein